MVDTAKDTELQLYRSVGALLSGDTTLLDLLGASFPENPRIYQTDEDAKTSLALKDDIWITFNASNVRAMNIEQTRDLHEDNLAIHVWQRGPGTDQMERVAARVNELLDGQDSALTNDRFLCYQAYWLSYSKRWEPVTSLWHLTSTFFVLGAALSPS